MYRPLFYTAICLLFSPSLAQAASDTKRSAPPSEDMWTGFYAGVNAGYAWSSSKATLSCPPSYAPNPLAYFSSTTAIQITESSACNLNTNGFTGGIQFGYNQYFSNNILLGFETDFGALLLTQNKTVRATFTSLSPAIYTLYQKIGTNWLYTLRPRLGYTFSKTLLFITGGLSLTDFQYKETYSDDVSTLFGSPPSANGYQSISQTTATVGWNVGAGVEYLVQKNLSIALSYLYTGFSNNTFFSYINALEDGQAINYPINGKATLSANLIRLGVNWHF